MMSTTERPTKKRPANISVNATLLVEAKALHINLSAVCESAIQVEVKARREAKWAEDNRAAIEALNDYVERHGDFSDGLRAF